MHSISMMIAARSAVVIWSVLGYGDEVFPSGPGMGAALDVHFRLCWLRNDEGVNPCGGYAVPTQQTKGLAGGR